MTLMHWLTEPIEPIWLRLVVMMAVAALLFGVAWWLAEWKILRDRRYADAGWCVTCGAQNRPAGDWGACTNPACVAFNEVRASVSYIPPHMRRESWPQGGSR